MKRKKHDSQRDTKGKTDLKRNGGIEMSDNEMVNLDEMGSLKASMEAFQQELLHGHRIDPTCILNMM